MNAIKYPPGSFVLAEVSDNDKQIASGAHERMFPTSLNFDDGPEAFMRAYAPYIAESADVSALMKHASQRGDHMFVNALYVIARDRGWKGYDRFKPRQTMELPQAIAYVGEQFVATVEVTGKVSAMNGSLRKVVTPFGEFDRDVNQLNGTSYTATGKVQYKEDNPDSGRFFRFQTVRAPHTIHPTGMLGRFKSSKLEYALGTIAKPNHNGRANVHFHATNETQNVRLSQCYNVTCDLAESIRKLMYAHS